MFIGKKTVFVHTPKCAGTFIREFLSAMRMGKSLRKWHVPACEFDAGDRMFFSSVREPLSYYRSLYSYHKKKPKRENMRFYNYWSTNQSFEKFLLDMINDKEEKVIDLALGRDPFKPVVKWMRDFDVGFFTVVHLYMCFDHKVFGDIGNYEDYKIVKDFVRVGNICEDMARLLNLDERSQKILKKREMKNVSDGERERCSQELVDLISYKDRLIYGSFYPEVRSEYTF